MLTEPATNTDLAGDGRRPGRRRTPTRPATDADPAGDGRRPGRRRTPTRPATDADPAGDGRRPGRRRTPTRPATDADPAGDGRRPGRRRTPTRPATDADPAGDGRRPGRRRTPTRPATDADPAGDGRRPGRRRTPTRPATDADPAGDGRRPGRRRTPTRPATDADPAGDGRRPGRRRTPTRPATDADPAGDGRRPGRRRTPTRPATDADPADVGSVEGLAYHRAWDALYWTSYTTSTITRHSIDQGRQGAFERETVVTMSGEDHPRAFVLDECLNLMFWTNWNEEHPSIMRSTLIGSSVFVIIGTDIRTPNGLAIDHQAEKLYFSDATLDKIERCEYDGSSRQVILKSEPVHSFGLAVYGDYIFWTDWVRRAVLRADKYTGGHLRVLRADIPQQPMGIIAVANDTNNCKLSPCKVMNGGCQDLCLLTPEGRVNCSCREGRTLLNDFTCSAPNSPCNIHSRV
ncbi:low-density lipoprotein receptor-related protein 1-like [Cetorhinus maximus]